MDIRSLRYFNKNGNPYNFHFNERRGIWQGVVVMPKVSVGLYQTSQIHIVQMLGSTAVHPYATEESTLVAHWSYMNEYVDEIFLFDFDDSQVIYETSALKYTPQDGPDIATVVRGINDSFEYNLQQLGDSDSDVSIPYDYTPIVLNIGFSSTPWHNATTYERTLCIDQKIGKHRTTIAEIKIYAESDDEDERLKVTCENLGYNILKDDSVIFKSTPIEEPLPDYMFLNKKRKEMLLEGSNIYPFVGSYRALVNAIKFYGYDNVSIREYYRNVDNSSQYYGKQYHALKYSLSQHEQLFVGNEHIILPSTSYRKINKISLVYNINTTTGTFDDWGLPQTEEQFDYTIEEAMIKLYGLRRKLDAEFMPGSSKIYNVIGEANYFGLNSISNTTFSSRFDYVTAGITPGFSVDNDSPFITVDSLFNAWLIEWYGAGISEFEPYELASYFDEYKRSSIDSRSMDFTDSDDDGNISAKFILTNTSFPVQTIEALDTLSISSYDDAVKIGTYETDQYNDCEWIITYDGDLKFQITYRGDISTYSSVYVEVPYTGTYTVTLKLFDKYNNVSMISKNAHIHVKPLNIEVSGFYYDVRPLPSQPDYDEQTKKDIIAIVDGIKSKIDESIDYDAYFWDNLETLKYKNTNHLTYDTTNHMDQRSDDSVPTLSQQFAQIRYIRDGVVLKPYTWICIGFDWSKIAGVNSIHWELSLPDGTSITRDTRYFDQLLKLEGNYTVTCTISDVNNNTHEVSRMLFNVKRSADYTSYQNFKKDLNYLARYK